MYADYGFAHTWVIAYCVAHVGYDVAHMWVMALPSTHIVALPIWGYGIAQHCPFVGYGRSPHVDYGFT